MLVMVVIKHDTTTKLSEFVAATDLFEVVQYGVPKGSLPFSAGS